MHRRHICDIRDCLLVTYDMIPSRRRTAVLFSLTAFFFTQPTGTAVADI